MTESNNILRPIPQRVWQVTPAPSDPPSPAVPADEAQEVDKQSRLSPNKTRSVLNLTSSTLYGIFSPAETDGSAQGISQSNTPFGTGAMTPQTPGSPIQTFLEDRKSPTIGLSEHSKRRMSQTPRRRRSLLSGTIVPFLIRSTLLFLSGMAYGVVVAYLHENKTLTPVKTVSIDRKTWRYSIYWGLAGVVMGNVFPWLDVIFEDTSAADKALEMQRPGASRIELEQRRKSSVVELQESDNYDGADWFAAARGIGVFMGIAFAIHKLPWESTSQAIVTLVLVNPILWYIVDRSKAGFIISLLFTFMATSFSVVVNPQIIPSPSGTPYPSSLTTSELVRLSTWVASVIFCSCVCFLNIGKMLASWGESA